MNFQRGINLSELVGDFVKDEQGNWWLVNIKAFRIEAKLRAALSVACTEGEERVGWLGEKEKYQRTKECRYCEKSYL